jgi:hypothetical protein
MRRADSTLAEPVLRDKWLERATDERSPADRDFITWSPMNDWRGPRGFRPVRTSGLLKATRGARLRLRNEQYIGGIRSTVSPLVIAEELMKAKAALDTRLVPGLLSEVLIERKVNRDRIRAILAERFGPVPDDELRRLASDARKEIERQLTAAFGFLPRYQIRWVGTL